MGHQSIYHPLTPMQEAFLTRGPNIAIVPKYPSKESYITAIEKACTRLPHREAEELRMEFSWLIRRNCPHKPNLTPEEIRAIKELKEDHSQVVLTADKGVAMVVMDREDYTDKAQSLHADTTTHKNHHQGSYQQTQK